MEIPKLIVRAELRRLYDQLGTAYVERADELKAQLPSQAAVKAAEMKIATVVRTIKDLQSARTLRHADVAAIEIPA